MKHDPDTLRAIAHDLRADTESLGEPADWDAESELAIRRDTLLAWAERLEIRAQAAAEIRTVAAPRVAPDTLTLLGYTFSRDYFDSPPNVRRWLADRGIEAQFERRGPFAYYARLLFASPNDNTMAQVDVDSGVTAVYGVPA